MDNGFVLETTVLERGAKHIERTPEPPATLALNALCLLDENKNKNVFDPLTCWLI